jgi:methyl-accepting chemotaxis protein
MSVKLKMMLLMGSLITIVVLMISIVGFINFKSASVGTYDRGLKNDAMVIGKAVEQKIGRTFDVLHAVAAELAITSDEKIDEVATLKSLKSIADKFDVLGAHIGMKNGDIYASLANGFVPNVNAKDTQREWYVRIFEGEDEVMTKVYTNGEGNLAIAMAVPVIREGERVGLLAVNIAVNSITNFVKELSDNAQIYISREDGYVLVAKDEALLGANLFVSHPSYKPLKDAEEATLNYSYDGNNYFVASTKIKNLGWNVWAWDSEKNINAASNSNLLTSLIIAFIFIVIALTITYILVNKLMYLPIGGEPKTIEKMVQRIANGDLSLNAEITGNETGVYKAVLSMVKQLKETISEINTTSTEVNNSSSQIENSANGVTQTAQQQMHHLEQTASAMNEMTVTVLEVARNAQQASSSANEAKQHSKKGMAVVSEMNHDISSLLNGIENVQVVINKLAQQTDNIGSILDVIKGVADQTNLLALNAAIEAARAGEQGRGFAVVADEVRNLANRTQESTDEIQQVITNLQAEAGRSVHLMDTNAKSAEATATKSNEANLALEAINRSVEEIQDMNNQIATAAEEQTVVAEDINNSIVSLNDMSKHTFDNAQNNSTMAKRLKNAAASLNRSVERFTL